MLSHRPCVTSCDEQMPYEAWRGLVDRHCVSTVHSPAHDLPEHRGAGAVEYDRQLLHLRSRHRLQTHIHTDIRGRQARCHHLGCVHGSAVSSMSDHTENPLMQVYIVAKNTVALHVRAVHCCSHIIMSHDYHQERRLSVLQSNHCCFFIYRNYLLFHLSVDMLL